MRALFIRLLTIGSLAFAGLAFAPLPAAQAAVPTGPSAVAVASNGITYVGFASGGSLSRIDASGGTIAPIPLPRSGPVDGLAVDSSNNIWVSYGLGASRISPTGAELSYVDYYPDRSVVCPPIDDADPTRFGGIAVSGSSLYVSGRCQGNLMRFALDGTKLQEIPTAANGRARGIAFGPAQNGQPAKVYVASPTSGEVHVYPENLSDRALGSTRPPTVAPDFTLRVPQAGSNTPVPAGVVVDKFGQLAVSDVANNKILLFDTNNINGPNSYSWYRDLGRTGSNAGDLRNPTALAQYPVDGPLSDRQGDFFIGDTGNSRVQRWNTSGYTYWSTSTTGGSVPQTAPVNTTRPAVSGTATVGSTLTCSDGTWSGSPTSFEYGWNRNGSSIGGESNKTYIVRSGDAGQGISCFVRATNGAGTSNFATSDAVTIGAAPAGPSNTALPVITGTATQGSTLTCSNGSWTGSPTYTRVWSRNGNPIAGATNTTYVVTAADVGQAVTCTVTATNANGSASATSTPVTPTGTAACTGNTTPGVSINNAATFTNSEVVTLRVVAPAGATAVLISNDGGFAGATSRALSGTCAYPWTLALTGNDRATKNVYVRFTGSGERFSDDIVLDKTSPAVARANARQVSKKQIKLKLKASDKISGVAKVEFAKNRKGKAAKVTKYKRNFTIKKKAKSRYKFVRVYDRAGNVSKWKKVKQTKKGKKNKKDKGKRGGKGKKR